MVPSLISSARRLRGLLLPLLLLPVLALASPGQSTWTGAVSSDWSDPGNWSTAAVPGTGTDVLVPPTANQPDLSAGTGQVRDLAILETAQVSTSGTGLLEVHGDLTLVASGAGTGVLALGPIGADVRLFGTLTQDDRTALTSAGGRLLLEGGAALAGADVLLPAATLTTGTTTLLAEAAVVDLVAAAGTSAGAFPWVFDEPVTEYSSGSAPIHHARIDAGTLWAKDGSIEHLHLNGGTLYLTILAQLEVTVLLEALAGEVDFHSLNSGLTISGDLVAGPGVVWDEGFVQMDGTTSITGPGGGTGHMRFVNFKSGLCTLLAPLRISGWVGASGGGTVAGDWIEMEGSSTISQGLLSQVRVVAGSVRMFGSTVDQFELVGGTVELVAGLTSKVVTTADLQGGTVTWLNPLTSKLEIQGDLISAPGVTFGAGTISMNGTTTISGPGGAPAQVGGIDLAGGVCDLLADVRIDGALKTSGGTSTGAWFECVGSAVSLQDSTFASTPVHRLRIVSGVATVEGPLAADDLELTGGVLRLPPGETMTVNTTAELLGGQLDFDDASATPARLEVLGDVRQVGTTAAGPQSVAGALVCHGVWTADAATDLGQAFVELEDGSSVTGPAPTFARLRFADGATATLLTPVVVTGRIENAGGTSQGQWVELQDDGVVLATTAGQLHDLRITAGRAVVENAMVEELALLGGDLEVAGGTKLTVNVLLDLVAGTVTMDPTDSGTTALVEVLGDVDMQGTLPGASAGTGGLLRCEGLWFGNGPCDLGPGFAELGGGATVLGSQASFRRLRVEDGPVSLNAVTELIEELVIAADSSTTGVSWFEARPGAAGTLTLSGGGSVSELRVVEGTVEQQGGGADTLRVLGGTLRVTGDATAGDLSLEGGALAVVEGATLAVAGDLDLTAGTLDFEAGDGSPARLDVAGTVDAAGSLPGASLVPTGVLSCAGAWLGSAPLDLGDVWVEVGTDGIFPTSLSGPALTFGRLRVVGEADLVDLVTVTTRLEATEGAVTTGEWFRTNGAACELATTGGSLHRVRQASGVLRCADAVVGELELAGGELLVEATATVRVDTWLELQAGSLAFDEAGGASSARIETFGVLHQVATTPGSVTHPDAGITAWGETRLDGALDLGAGRLDLMPGARITGAAASLTRLRVPLHSSVLADAAIEAATTVTAELEVQAGAGLALTAGDLVLACPPVLLDGHLRVGPGLALVVTPASGVTVAAGGGLALVGTVGSPAELRGLGGGWDLTVDGSLEGRWFAFRDIDNLTLGPAATLGPLGLLAGSLERGLGVGPGPLLDLGAPGSFDLIGLDFTGGAGDANVSRPLGAGEVTLRAFGGALGGAAFEDDPAQGGGDPDGQLVWLNTVEPDLLPLELEGEASAIVGWTTRVDYTAINQGGGTAAAPWVDRLWLTKNLVIGDEDDVGLAKFTRSTDLSSGDLMAAGADVLMPAVDEGTWYLALRLDNGGVVAEGADAGDNLIFSAPLEVYLSPRPNLAVVALDGPSTATDGDTVEVTWTVDNVGLGATDELTGLGGTWQDRVYLSDDDVFGGDHLLATFAINAGELPGGIAPGGSYTETRSVDLPAGISGDHRLIVRSDAIDEVTPEESEADNVLVAPALLTVTQAALPDLVGAFDPLTSPLGELFAGAPADLAWTVTNDDPDLDGLGSALGTVRLRFHYSLDPTLDASDTLILEQVMDLDLAPLGTEGGTAQVDLPAIAGTWWVIGELDVDGAVAELDELNNVWDQQLSIVAPGYTGSVATTFTEGLAAQASGALTIPLTGQSTVAGSAQLVPDADLTVRVRRGDTRRVFEVTTDAAGSYSFDFEPLVGEAGLFQVYCDHPAVEEDPLQPEAVFTLHDLAVTPASLSESLVTGELRLVSLGLENPGTQPLTGLTLTPVGLPGHLAIQSVSLPASLPAGAADLATFELVALADAPDPPGPTVPAGLSLDLGFDLAGTPTVARSLPLDVWVTPASPDPAVVGLAPAIVVDSNGTTRVVLDLVNQGGAPLTNAAFALETAADLGLSCPTQEPFLPAVPTALGDVGPGEGRLLAFDVLGGACDALVPGLVLPGYTVTLTADQGTWAFPVDMTFGTTPVTSLTVRVQDAGAWWGLSGFDLGGAGPKVFGAGVTLTDAAGQVHSTSTNFQGKAVLSGLTPGLHDLVVESPPGVGAPTHVTWRGLVRVLVGQDTEAIVYLPAAPPQLEVTASEGQDGALDFDLVSTPAGPAAAGELVVTAGQLLDLDLAVGASAQFQVDLTQSGGAPVRGIELVAPDLPDFDFEPESWFVGDLDQGQTATVVLTVTRTGLGDPCALAAPGAHGLRYQVPADEAIWRWTPLLLVAPELQGPCAPRVVGGAAPDGLAPPLALPPAPDLALPPTVPYLGGRRLGTWPRPVAPLPADLILPL